MIPWRWMMEKKRSAGLRFFLAFFITAWFCFGTSTQIWAGNGPNDHGPYVADELLIQPKAGVPHEKVKEIFEAFGAVTEEEIPQIRVKRIKVPPQALERVKDALSRHPHINFAEYNFLAEPTVTPNDNYYLSQWHLPKISAPLGWDISEGSSNVAIAILDTGIDPTHPDLSGKLLPGYNFYDRNTDTHDVYGHGTAVAGSAAALSNNYTGVAGVAWNNPIMPLRISDPSGWATYSAMASAMTYAADRGVKVINLSYAGSSSSSTLQNAVNYAWNKGAVIVASAGNYSTSTPYYPAACNNVVSVSATTSSDTIASFSNYGNWIDLSAPGVSILTTNNGGGYGSWSGTSFSSPITAGVAALVFSANPSLSNAQVVEILLENADNLGTPGFDPYYGWGRINAYKSLLAAINSTPQPDTTPPIVSITSPANGSTLSGQTTVSVSATDDVGVSKVDLYINGALFLTDNTEPYNFFWDTTKYADGAYDLVARAYDPSGNIGQSNVIKVYVSNPKDTIPPIVSIIPPIVSIISPTNGLIINKNVIKIQVQASDNVGISRMELYIDGVLKLVTNSSTISWSWNTVKVANGQHAISAKAYDGAGNAGSNSITVYK
jgi:hypothetical protein